MKSVTVNPSANTLSIEWYVPNDFYGSRYRVVLVPDETLSFSSSKDAKKWAAKLSKWVNEKYIKPNKLKRVATSDAKYDTYENLPTYIYMSMGPSYSCQNIIKTTGELS